MNVNVTSVRDILFKVDEWLLSPKGRYICVANVHMCMETFDSQSFRKVVNHADLVVPDGKPLSIAQKLLGHKKAVQIRGQDIMHSLCELSGPRDINIGFYGGSSDAVLNSVRSNLVQKNPNVQITYSFCPPFRSLSPEEDFNVSQEINNANVDILFVGIGCPKQEVWMAEHKNKINCIMLGVGAAFDFISGNKKEAPRWMQKMGMEWLFRLASEPRRLWKRYLKHNPRFVYYFIRQLLGKKYI